MAQKLKKIQQPDRAEQTLARAQRQELQEELTESFVQSIPRERRRVITFSILGCIALLAGIFTLFVLLPTSNQAPQGGVAVGQPAPDFTLPVLGGQGQGSIQLSHLRGHPVVINFWSESCSPCLAEMPYLREIYTHYHQQGAFMLLGVNQADPREDITSFGRTYKINYPLLYDPHSQTNVDYGVTSLPMTYFIDNQGIVRFVVPQQLTPATMQQGLQAIGVDIS